MAKKLNPSRPHPARRRQPRGRLAFSRRPAKQLLDLRAQLEHLGQRLGIELEHLVAPRRQGLEQLQRLLHAQLGFGWVFADGGVGEHFAQHFNRRRNLAALALTDDAAHQLPDLFRSFEMVAPVTPEVHQLDQAPALELANAVAHIGARNVQRVGNLFGVHRPAGDVKQRVNLRMCWALRLRGTPPGLALSADSGSAFPFRQQGRHPQTSFSELDPPAHRSLCLRFARYLTITNAKLEARMVSLFLSCRALSSPTICRFIPAH